MVIEENNFDQILLCFGIQSTMSVLIGATKIPKTAGLAGLEGLLNLLLQQAEGLADFREIFVFICETLKTRRICSCCYGN